MNCKHNVSNALRFCFLFFIVGYIPLYAETLQTVKTKYFDIIYAEASAPSAALLAEYADGYAEEICAALRKEMKDRMPVYLVSGTEELNGYFISLPYRRIVIYDTAVTDGQLGNLTDTVLQVFYHELTHAVSLGKFPSPLNLLPMSFVEGVAVSFESLYGQGRLHDPLIKQYLIQNKIDGTTPTWQEAAGTRDMYPGGLWPYIYGGYFSEYLQKTYGMETYSKLWQPSWNVFIPGKFRSVYKKEIRHVWNQFINTIPIPEKLKEPMPFPSQSEQSGYTALAASSDGFAYYDFDRKAVYFTTVHNSGINGYGQGSASVKLFTADSSLSYLSFSEDGTLLAVSDSLAKGGKTAQKRCRIFDMKSRTFVGEPFASVLAACFIDERNLCAVMLKNQTFSAVLLDRSTGEVKKRLYTAGPGRLFAALYSPCYIGNGHVALIAANGVKRTILCIDTETGACAAIPEQEAPYAIRYLQSVKSGDEYVLTFSWAKMDMLYRLGLYYPESGTLKTQQTDISGGVFFPVIVSGQAGVSERNGSPNNEAAPVHVDVSNEAAPAKIETDNHAIVYVGIHGAYHRLYTMTETELVPKTVQLAGLSAQTVLSAEEPAHVEESVSISSVADTVTGDGVTGVLSKRPRLEILNSERYRPTSWLWKAAIFPSFSIPNDMQRIGGYGFGLKLAMLDPTETVSLNPSFTVFSKPFFMQGAFEAAFHFKPLSLRFNVFDQLDAAQFTYRRTGLNTGIHCGVPLSYSWETLEMDYQGTAAWISLLSDKEKTYYTAPYRYTVLAHEGQLRYKNVRSSSIIRSPYFAKDTQGIIVSGAAAHAYCIERKAHAAVLQAKFDGYLPVVPIRFTLSGYFGVYARLNPLNGAYSHIAAGFPVTATRYFPAFEAYESAAVRRMLGSMRTGALSGGVSGTCDVTVFSYEVQTGGFFSPLFLNRITFHTGYAGVLTGSFGSRADIDLSAHKGNFLYLDTAYLNGVLTFNGNAEVGLEYAHPLRTPLRSGVLRALFDVKL